MIALVGLILIGGWVWLALRISKPIKEWIGKYKYGNVLQKIVFPVLLILPLMDEIIGNIFMENVLCEDANELVILTPIDFVKKAKAVHLPDETIWFGIPIEKLQVDYIDLDTNQTFAYSRSYITHGGWLMRYILDFGNFGNCGRWSIKTRHYSEQTQTSIKLEQLLKTGEAK